MKSSKDGPIFSGPQARAIDLKFTAENMIVYLEDGRAITIPLDWYPRLERATPKQRKNYRFIYDRFAMEWPDIDEHISVPGLLQGNKAPRTKAYLTGKFSDSLERRLREIEGSYKQKKSIPSARAKRVKAKHS